MTCVMFCENLICTVKEKEYNKSRRLWNSFKLASYFFVLLESFGWKMKKGFADLLVKYVSSEKYMALYSKTWTILVYWYKSTSAFILCFKKGLQILSVTKYYLCLEYYTFIPSACRLLLIESLGYTQQRVFRMKVKDSQENLGH